METIYLDGNNRVYLRFELNDKLDESCPLPFISFILGAELEYNTWNGGVAFFKGEEGFVMDGEEYQTFLNNLKSQIQNYKEMQLKIYHHYADTNANLLIDCQKSMIVLKGQLGSTLIDGLPVLNFTLRNLDSSFLINLYDVLVKNTKF